MDVTVKVPLTPREIELILEWKEEFFWPDEKRVRDKLQSALSSDLPLELSLLQARIVLGWVEEEVGGHYGGGEVMTPEERAILSTLRGVVASS